MPLKIETGPFGVRPVILCDYCGEPIADARDGNYHWQADEAAFGDERSRRFTFFTHKACCGVFELERGGAASWFAMELADLLPALAASLRLVGERR